MKPEVLENYLKGSVSVVCYDAGAANIIINWIRKIPELKVKAHLEGPAKDLWDSIFPNSVNYSLDDVFKECDILISGTGWASDLEHKARIMALSKGLLVVAVIDSWVNYKMRFFRNGRFVYPNEIWVVDEHAFSLAKSKFSELKVRLLPNYYLDDQVAKIKDLQKKSLSKSNTTNILYALEPIRIPWLAKEAVSGEFQALDYFVSNIANFTESHVEIRLRPHPSDFIDKYKDWINQQCAGLKIEISKAKTLVEDLAWSDVVVGCQTYVLVIALFAGKRPLISLPPWAPRSLLPYSEIEELRTLLGARK